MICLVFGSRDYDDADAVDIVLSGVRSHYRYNEFVIIEGGAPGADRLGASFALREGIKHRCFEADWEQCAAECPPGHRRTKAGSVYCPTAGHRRNQLMLDEGKPRFAVGFLSKPLSRSRGSYDMYQRILAKGNVDYLLIRSRMT